MRGGVGRCADGSSPGARHLDIVKFLEELREVLRMQTQTFRLVISTLFLFSIITIFLFHQFLAMFHLNTMNPNQWLSNMDSFAPQGTSGHVWGCLWLS